jgi:twitching motility protein PilT
MVRIHGDMRKLQLPDAPVTVLTAEDVQKMVYDILTDTQKKNLETNKEVDFSMTLGDVARFRANVFFQDRGVGGVFRVIPTKILGFEELGLPEVVRDLTFLEKGLVLVTGPTGSGKSTTLAAMIDLINENRQAHIITIEDPIEFVHVCKKSMVNQRELHAHTHSFANALRAALREDPDVILIGEMRDLETISLAITAAETGHLVFGTLHTNSAPKTVDRVINVFPAGEQAQIRAMFAESILGIVSQILLHRKDGKGRVAAHEILVATSAVRAMIRDGKTHQIASAIQTGSKYGMQSLEQSLTKLINRGAIDRSEAERFTLAEGSPIRTRTLQERKMQLGEHARYDRREPREKPGELSLRERLARSDRHRQTDRLGQTERARRTERPGRPEKPGPSSERSSHYRYT